MKKIPCILSILLALLLAVSCTEICFTPSVEQVQSEVDSDRLLPQEGTTLRIRLDYQPTKCRTFETSIYYQYAVYIDDHIYAFGMVERQDYIDIPLIANDSYHRKTVVVKGAKALLSDSTNNWESWHEIFRCEQACLPESEPLRYRNLDGRRLVMTVGEKRYYFSLFESGTSEALKRLLSEGPITVDAQIGMKMEMDKGKMDLRPTVPENIEMYWGFRFSGNLYYSKQGHLYICLVDNEVLSYDTLLGTICDESATALADLYPGPFRHTKATVTLAIEDMPDVEVEWAYEGWDDVYNDLDQKITITTCHSFDDNYGEPLTPHEIAPGEYARLNHGCYLPGESIRERQCLKVDLADGRQMRLDAGGYEVWNRTFFDKYKETQISERVPVGGSTVPHTYYTRIYRITPELLYLWEYAD